ncbi:MAG: hypothetical protein HEQ10_17200 [Dolichospermum sp. DEX182a]|jgi:hypothetical protein|nr:hypothetical protein [Dolichospermum sp. DEX182a]
MTVQTVQKIQSSIFSIKEWQAAAEQEAALDREARREKLRDWMRQENFTDISGKTNPHKCSLPIRYGHPDFSFFPEVPKPKAIDCAYEPSGSVPSKAKDSPANNRKAPLDLLKLELLLEEAERLVVEIRLLISISSIPHKAFGIQEEVPLEAAPSTEFEHSVAQVEEVAETPACAELKEAEVEEAVVEEAAVETIEVATEVTENKVTTKLPSKAKRKKATSEQTLRSPSKGKTYRGAGYIFRKKTIVTLIIWAAFEQILAGLDDGTKRFFKHLYICSCVLKKEEGWVQLPSQLIRQEFGITTESITELESRGIIEINHSYAVGFACKKYRIPPSGTEAIEDAILESLESGELSRVVLETGKPTRAALTSSIYDENNHKLPELVASRILTYKNAVVFDKSAALSFLRQKLLAAKVELSKNGYTKLYESLYSSYRNDANCLSSVVYDHAAIDLPNGKCSYVPAFKAQVSGRITHLGGGFQSASRGLTAAAFCEQDYINYDLKSAQPAVYLQMLEQYNISDGGWLQDYISGVTGKKAIAEKLGLSIDSWKKIFLAVLMGARVPAWERAEKGFLSISRALAAQARNKKKHKKFVVDTLFASFLEEFNNDPQLAFQAFRKFTDVCAPFLAAVREVGNLIKTAIKTQDDTILPQLFKGKEGSYIKNAAGMSLQLAGIPKSGLISKVQAHLLQGAESCLISNILKQSEEYGFKPVLDFHDGFLSRGEVPQEAIDKAVAACGIRGALEIKPLVSPF